jgi:hypothetical protein
MAVIAALVEDRVHGILKAEVLDRVAVAQPGQRQRDRPVPGVLKKRGDGMPAPATRPGARDQDRVREPFTALPAPAG